MVAVPTGCVVSPPPLFSQNMQSHEKSPTNHRAQGVPPTVSLALGANRKGKGRVKGKASRIRNSRIGSALVCVRRNAQHPERVCVCVFSRSFWTSSSLDVPAGVTQEEGHTGFFIHLLSAIRALIFLARRIQPFLSLVDRELEFCVLLTTLIVFHPLGTCNYVF